MEETAIPVVVESNSNTGKYEGMSTWGYVGSILLMCIPVLGWIVAIIWALGGCRKYAKRNLARAVIILTIITLLISAASYFVFERYIKNASLDDIMALPFVKTIMEKTGITQEQIESLGTLSETLEAQGMDINDLVGQLSPANS